MKPRGTLGTKNLFLIGFAICFMLLSAGLAEDSYAIVVRNDSEAVVFSEDFESYNGNLPQFPPIIGDVGISPSGHYFTYRGKTKMILADSGTQCVMQNLNIDYRTWVNATAAEGHSSVHIWAFIAPRQKLDGSEVESRYGYVYPGITPWARKTSGDNAYDGGKQWDLFSFDEGTDPNQHYWPRLRDLCQQLKDKNRTLGITVFFGWPKDIPGDLYYHPFYHLNGGPATSRGDITHIHSPGTEIHTQAWNDSWSVRKKNQWLWEKFCLKLINETSDYGNVWFDFRDEWSYDTDTNMESHFRHFFMDRGQVWADRSASANFRVLNPDIPPFGLTPAMKTEGGPYDHDGVRVEVWTRAMGGIHYLLHNDARSPGIMAWDPNTGRDPDDDLGRKYVGYASRFFNTHLNNLDSMVPNNSLVNNGAKCLANIGQEYVIYLPDGGSITVDLSDATGTFEVDWYNPKDGRYYDEGTVTGGGSETFTPLFSGDAVLYIRDIDDGTLEITSYTPKSSVNDSPGATRTFNITINQRVNVSWQINGLEVQTNCSITEASYTNTSAVVGTWNVSVIVTNTNGTDMQTWVWTVTSPCFIATAAYGTPLHEGIDVLRDFRDEYLMTNPLGRGLVKIYYSTSPPIADVIRENEGLGTAIRVGLVKPSVYILRNFVG